MDVKSYLPVIIRYVIASAAAFFAAHGWLSPEQNTVVSQNLDALAGALVVIATVAYALWRRPSTKALAVAKAVDANVPKDQPAIVKTPSGAQDIVVPPK